MNSQQSYSGEKTLKQLRLPRALKVTLTEETNVSEACRRMAERRVDAVLLTNSNGFLSGIFTAKDVSARVISELLQPEQTILSKVMTRNPVFVMADVLVSAALQKMVEGNFRHLPVVEDGEVIAVLDITKCLYDMISRMEKAAEQDTLRERMFKPLSTIITENTNIAVVSPSDPVYVATKKMREHRVNSVVIVTDDKLQGILTSKDVLRRVVAQNLSPELILVEEAMMPSPKCSTLDTTILDALRIMHNGKFLHLPVLDRDGHVAACLDVLQITRAAISMLDQSGQSYPTTSEGEHAECHHGSQLSNFRNEWSSLELPYLDIKEATNGFSESSKIGKGGYGSVYLGNLGGTMVAIKMLESTSKQGLKEFFQELEVLYQMRHPNLVKLVGACFEVRALVYEYLPNGSVEDCLKHNPNLLTWQMRTRIVYEICLALTYLHSRSVVHGDLKPANILLDANFKSKLADFGLCRFLPEDMTTNVFLETAPKGTSGYIDPWFFETSILRPGSDLYSFGITILKLLTRMSPLGLGRRAHDADEDSFREMIDLTAGSWPFDLAKELLYWSLQCCYRNERSMELLKDMSVCLEDMLAEIETLLGGSLKSVVAEGKKGAEDPLEVLAMEEKNEEEKEEEKPML